MAKRSAGFPLLSSSILPFKIKNILFHKSTYHSAAWYDIHFEGGMSLSATSLHAFVTIRGHDKIFMPTNYLSQGDIIWVDTSAFGADKSLRKTSRHS